MAAQAFGAPMGQTPATAIAATKALRNHSAMLFFTGMADFVDVTPMLGWEPAPTAAHADRVMLLESTCCKAFLSRSAPAPGAAARHAASTASVLEFILGEAAWTRILSEIVASGMGDALDEAGAMTFTDFLTVFATTVFPSPDQLQLDANDYELSESFDIPAQPGRAGRGRGRGGAIAAVPAVHGPDILRPLSLCSFLRFYESNAVPQFFDLFAALGPCTTRAQRLLEASSLHALAGHLNSILASPSFGAATDGSRSMAMPSLLRRSVLPPHLRCHGTEALELFEEQRDALTFHLGDSERAAVTAARLDFLSRTLSSWRMCGPCRLTSRATSTMAAHLMRGGGARFASGCFGPGGFLLMCFHKCFGVRPSIWSSPFRHSCIATHSFSRRHGPHKRGMAS